MTRILVIDDEKGICDFLAILFAKEGYKVKTIQDPKKVINVVEEWKPEIVLVDLRFPNANGLDILSNIKDNFPSVIVILITAYASLDSAIEAMRRGAFDYITKPFKIEEIRLVLKRAIETQQLKSENVELKHKLEEAKISEHLIGSSKPFKNMLELIRKVAITDSTILIYGESGTGKELVAREIHKLSNRKDAHFVAINCGALPETLLESELFGHTKGSFTGAIKDSPGLFKSADKGTLLLDEISVASPKIQVDLLRVLEQKEITPVGSTETIPVNVRLITATNKNLEQLVKEEKFREDLFYRINVIQICIPPLRERKEDISLLVEHFLKRYCAKHSLPAKSISSRAMDILLKYAWPGNIRELENTIERAIILERNKIISVEALPDKIKETLYPITVTSLDLSIRQEEIMRYIETHRKITSKICSSIFQISQRTARNDLQFLVDLGLISKEGSAKKTTSYILKEN